ncbi:hypothetical protein O9993_08690 [Vibrio lentus]|nr:hypothetical protein [Vibrio lentus]
MLLTFHKRAIHCLGNLHENVGQGLSDNDHPTTSTLERYRTYRHNILPVILDCHGVVNQTSDEPVLLVGLAIVVGQPIPMGINVCPTRNAVFKHDQQSQPIHTIQPPCLAQKYRA